MRIQNYFISVSILYLILYFRASNLLTKIDIWEVFLHRFRIENDSVSLFWLFINISFFLFLSSNHFLEFYVSYLFLQQFWLQYQSISFFYFIFSFILAPLYESSLSPLFLVCFCPPSPLDPRYAYSSSALLRTSFDAAIGTDAAKTVVSDIAWKNFMTSMYRHNLGSIEML